MRIKQTIRLVLLFCFTSLNLYAQSVEPVDSFQLDEFVITGVKKTTTDAVLLPVVNIPHEALDLHMGHSLMDALSHTEGVQSMDIGIGFSKPVIRGLGFQRIVVIDNEVKQEGQQWGADHGLEIDAFNVEDVKVVKGPASVIYGSDAMGGVIELLPPPIPMNDTLLGEFLIQHQSVCSGFSGSVMMAVKRNKFYSQIRYTERHWGDYRVPADSFTYLSVRFPITDSRLKNTAGKERCANILFSFKNERYEGRIGITDSYQKSGFFSDAHGIPSSSNLGADGNNWNIDLPYSSVNHLKIFSSNKWTFKSLQTSLVLACQDNHREEWSYFHTHSVGQFPPSVDPDKELMLDLKTFSANLKLKQYTSNIFSQSFGISASCQDNEIGGYGFLIPEYRRNEYGIYYLSNFKIGASWELNASARYDLGYINTKSHGSDVSGVARHFNDYSFAVGTTFSPDKEYEFRVSVGRAYRLPSANELTSNGVHHGAFRHELGDESLDGEKGLQFDLSYSLHKKRIEISVSPFLSYYSHFISLHPTGQWSMLPDAGQIYKYVDSPASFYGGELHVKVNMVRNFYYDFSGEYIYSMDLESHTSTPFSPPASMRNTLSWECKQWQVYVESHSVAPQKHVCHNEDETPGYNLFNVGGKVDFPIKEGNLSLLVNAGNIFNTSYLNHLNFYRKIELPEAGFDFQTTIRLTF
ncbi:MAG: TonB-dependent receptor [Paludibacteraceae bacterium]|nr:TonB-dependent receptor [Paludibacteraceae bacterium]